MVSSNLLLHHNDKAVTYPGISRLVTLFREFPVPLGSARTSGQSYGQSYLLAFEPMELRRVEGRMRCCRCIIGLVVVAFSRSESMIRILSTRKCLGGARVMAGGGEPASGGGVVVGQGDFRSSHTLYLVIWLLGLSRPSA